MKRRSFLKSTMTALASVAFLGAQPSLTLARTRTVEMVLLEPGLDERGDFITVGCIKEAAEQFQKSFRVERDFDPSKDRWLGWVTGMRIQDNKLIARVELYKEGSELIEQGYELACGWISNVDVKEYQERYARGQGRIIRCISNISASLTRNKVQTIQSFDEVPMPFACTRRRS